MKTDKRLSRRGFLRGSAAAALSAPYVLTSTALGAAGIWPASDRVAVAVIGLRGKGGGHLKALLAGGQAQVVALCDVDRRVRRQALNRVAGGDCPPAGIAAVGDFREVCARDDVDAVVVATPDHTHAVIALAALRAGKDAYVEKPLTHTIREGRVLADEARRCGRIVQCGHQRRSSPRYALACELVRAGRIGRLVRVETAAALRPAQPMPWSPEPVPAGFDYDLWLGPAAEAPYTAKRCHYNFRYIRDYSGGELTGSAAHGLDLAQWVIGADAGGPVAVEGCGQCHAGGLWNTFHRFHVEWTYADGTRVVCESGETPAFAATSAGQAGQGGTRFIGTDGWLDPDTLQGAPAAVVAPLPTPAATAQGESRLPPAGGSHMRNFLSCVRSRRAPAATAEIGHRSATVCHLGNIALTLGRPLRWDPRAEQFPGDEEANRLTWRAYRSPWAL
jgi:predicted dehydrogenase